MMSQADQGSGQPVWDRIYASGGFGMELHPEFVTLCEDLSSGRALDVGAGEGAYALWLAARGWRVDAMDISADGIARLRERARQHGLTVESWVGSAADQEFAAGAYDLVICSGDVLNFFRKTEAKRIIERLGHAAKPGGCIYISVSTVADPAYQRRRREAEKVEEDSFFVESMGAWVTGYRVDELPGLLPDFDIQTCHERQVPDKHGKHGNPHTHEMAFLVARKRQQAKEG